MAKDAVDQFFNTATEEQQAERMNEVLNIKADALETSFKIQALTYVKSQLDKVTVNNRLKTLISEILLKRVEDNVDTIPIDTILRIWRELDNSESRISAGIFGMLQKQTQINIGTDGSVSGTPKYNDEELLRKNGFTKEEIQSAARIRQFFIDTTKTEGLSDEKAVN